VLSRDLTAVINTAIQCLVEFRPLSVSMGNAIKFVKLQARPRQRACHLRPDAHRRVSRKSRRARVT